MSRKLAQATGSLLNAARQVAGGGAMTEEECLSKLRDGISDAFPVPATLLEESDAAVFEHPASSELWLLRGHLIQLGNGDPRWPLDDAIRSYERALELAPSDPEVHEALGYWYDVIDVQLERALRSFERAWGHGGGRDSYLGMARVLAELGRRDQALRMLEPARCPFHQDPEVLGLLEEIEEGHWDPT